MQCRRRASRSVFSKTSVDFLHAFQYYLLKYGAVPRGRRQIWENAMMTHTRIRIDGRRHSFLFWLLWLVGSLLVFAVCLTWVITGKFYEGLLGERVSPDPAFEIHLEDFGGLQRTKYDSTYSTELSEKNRNWRASRQKKPLFGKKPWTGKGGPIV